MNFNQITEASIAYIMMNENILLEDRLEYMKQNTKKLDTSHDPDGKLKDTPDIIQHFADNADPTNNKQHTQFIVGLYRNKAIRQEDAPKIKTALENFEKYKNKLSPDEKQLSVKNYPSIEHVENKIAPHLGTMASKKQAQKTLEQPGHELVHDDDKISIYKLTDKDASKNLYGGGHTRGGTGTSWCTAARSDECKFDDYIEKGPLHVVHRKSDGAVFQYHPETNSFQDAENENISADDLKSLSPNLQSAWRKNPKLL